MWAHAASSSCLAAPRGDVLGCSPCLPAASFCACSPSQRCAFRLPVKEQKRSVCACVQLEVLNKSHERFFSKSQAQIFYTHIQTLRQDVSCSHPQTLKRFFQFDVEIQIYSGFKVHTPLFEGQVLVMPPSMGPITCTMQLKNTQKSLKGLGTSQCGTC